MVLINMCYLFFFSNLLMRRSSKKRKKAKPRKMTNMTNTTTQILPSLRNPVAISTSSCANVLKVDKSSKAIDNVIFFICLKNYSYRFQCYTRFDTRYLNYVIPCFLWIKLQPISLFQKQSIGLAFNSMHLNLSFRASVPYSAQYRSRWLLKSIQ